MNSKTKYITLALIILTISILTSCAQFNIEAQITPDNLVTYSYTFNFDNMNEDKLNYEELKLFLLDIQKYWGDNGIKCDMNIYENNIEFIGTMEKQCETREEAFETLYQYMTNKISLFDNVTLNYTDNYYTTEYSLTSTVDLTGIVDEQIYEVHPTIVDEDVDEFINSLKCTATFSLPYNDNIDSLEIIQNKIVSDIALTSPTNIVIAGIIHNNDLKINEKDLLNKRNKQRISIIIFALLGLLTLCFSILLIVKLIKSKDKPNKNEKDINNISSDS